MGSLDLYQCTVCERKQYCVSEDFEPQVSCKHFEFKESVISADIVCPKCGSQVLHDRFGICCMNTTCNFTKDYQEDL